MRKKRLSTTTYKAKRFSLSTMGISLLLISMPLFFINHTAKASNAEYTLSPNILDLNSTSGKKRFIGIPLFISSTAQTPSPTETPTATEAVLTPTLEISGPTLTATNETKNPNDYCLNVPIIMYHHVQ